MSLFNRGSLFAGALFAGALLAGQEQAQAAGQAQGSGGGAWPTIAKQPAKVINRLVIPVENIEEEDEEQVIVFVLAQIYKRRLL